MDLIIFPECALTGYPPRDIVGADSINANAVSKSIQELQKLAVENATSVLSVNAIDPNQTAPTCFINASGSVCKELEKNREGMLIYDFEKKELDFGEVGRKRYSDQLLRNSG